MIIEPKLLQEGFRVLLSDPNLNCLRKARDEGFRMLSEPA